MKIPFIWILLCITFFYACKKSEFVDLSRGTLVETADIGTISKSEIASYIDEFEIGEMAQHDVQVVKITYVSESNGKTLKTDGLLLIPKQVDSVYFLSYFHGTAVPLDIFKVKRGVPSLYNLEKKDFFEVRNIGLAWAAAGYTVFLPDYIGYGRTAKEEHPYIYYAELFKANIDGMLACKKYFSDKDMHYDNRAFLTGWSQGGGASLSAHKMIQESYSHEFEVVASSSLAGPHDCYSFLMDVFQHKDNTFPMINIYSWALYSVNKFSGLNRPTDQIWKYPVYDQESSFNVQSKIPSKLLKDGFIGRMIDGKDVEMISALHRNTYSSGWLPVGKVILHHGDADDIVPYFNSVNAKEGLTAAGGDVLFFSYPGGTHLSEVENFVRNTHAEFNLLK